LGAIQAMYLTRLELREFRSYERLAIGLPAGTVVFHGPNGAGKTNLLEGMCVTAAGDSPRARTIGELVRIGSDHGFVRAGLVREERPRTIEVGLAARGQRRIRIDGVARRRADLVGIAPVVLFWAADIEVLRGEPSGRRRMLDRELCAVRQSYDYHLARYRRAVEQRNNLLKALQGRRHAAEALAPWENAAARHGARVMVERSRFLASLAPHAERAYSTLTGGQKGFAVAYGPSVAMPAAQSAAPNGKDDAAVVEEVARTLAGALKERRSLDRRQGVTTVGPHRDDIELSLEGRPVRAFASQGEQRSCAVAVRMGFAAVVRLMTDEAPVLLLDDVLSELDERHRRGVFAACEAEQVIVTCCDEQDVPSDVLAASAVFAIEEGKVVSHCARSR
jgi:DNA replication and repair protein RecF